MGNRRAPAIALAGLLLLGAVPAAAQSPSPSAGSGSTTTASVPSRWKSTKDVRLRRSGVLRHIASVGSEVIALAPGTDKQGQGLVKVLASKDGRLWKKRGLFRLVGSVNDLVADGSTLFAVGWDEGAAVWRSDDGGRRWSRPVDGAPFAGGADGGAGDDQSASAVAIARGPVGLLVVGSVTDPATLARRGAAWRSVDGGTWERLAGAATLPPFRGLAADAKTWVAISGSAGGGIGSFAADPSVLRWSTDGEAWSVAEGSELGAGETVDGVIALRSGGFLAWGATTAVDAPEDAPAIIWTSADGRAWARQAPDAALAGADLAAIRSLEGGAITLGVGGDPTGANAFPLLGDAWRKDTIAGSGALCVKDVASVKAILVAVGGSCGAKKPSGRAWTSPLEP